MRLPSPSDSADPHQLASSSSCGATLVCEWAEPVCEESREGAQDMTTVVGLVRSRAATFEAVFRPEVGRGCRRRIRSASAKEGHHIGKVGSIVAQDSSRIIRGRSDSLIFIMWWKISSHSTLIPGEDRAGEGIAPSVMTGILTCAPRSSPGKSMSSSTSSISPS